MTNADARISRIENAHAGEGLNTIREGIRQYEDISTTGWWLCEALLRKCVGNGTDEEQLAGDKVMD